MLANVLPRTESRMAPIRSVRDTAHDAAPRRSRAACPKRRPQNRLRSRSWLPRRCASHRSQAVKPPGRGREIDSAGLAQRATRTAPGRVRPATSHARRAETLRPVEKPPSTAANCRPRQLHGHQARRARASSSPHSSSDAGCRNSTPVGRLAPSVAAQVSPRSHRITR